MKPKRVLPRVVAGLLCVAVALALIAAAAPPALAQGNPPLWFQFNVGSVDPDEDTSHVSVILRDQAHCQGGFTVSTAENWSYWRMPTMGDPVGRATDIGYGMHMWAAELVPGAYYVGLGSGASPGCKLAVAGNAVDFVGQIDRGWNVARQESPAEQPIQFAQAPVKVVAESAAPSPSVAVAPPAAPRPAPAAPAIAAVPVQPAHHAMEMTPNEWMPVTDNEPMMFEFYVGHVRDDDTSSVSVTLLSGPFRTGRFEIFTAEGKPFDVPEHNDWFGTAESVDGRYASWHGDLVPGVYYVLVYPEGMKDCMLAVSGQSVTF